MWVKICANTNLEDALLAAEAGADALGFVFAPSKRQVAPLEVRAIAQQLPSAVERVGVFTEASAEEILNTVEVAGLHAVQLHRGFDLSFSRNLRKRLPPSVSLIETVHWRVGEDEASAALIKAQLNELAEGNDRVLLDAKLGTAAGGLGIPFHWEAAQSVVAEHSHLRVIVAGGLTPDNVAGAISILHPWGVDVASGVEHERGRKDPEKVRRFIENARRA